VGKSLDKEGDVMLMEKLSGFEKGHEAHGQRIPPAKEKKQSTGDRKAGEDNMKGDDYTSEPAPDSHVANRANNAAAHRLGGNVGVAQARKRQSTFPGKFTGQRLDLHNDLRGKRRGAARALAARQGQGVVRRRSVFATCRQSGGEQTVDRRFVCSPALLPQGG